MSFSLPLIVQHRNSVECIDRQIFRQHPVCTDSRTDMQLHIARYIHGMESRTSGLLKLSPSKNITKMYCTCYEVLKKKHKIMRSLSSIKHLFRFINQFVFYHCFWWRLQFDLVEKTLKHNSQVCCFDPCLSSLCTSCL